MLAGARAMGIPMSDEQAEQFEAYHALLTQANRRMNLTRVPEDPAAAVDRNYLDSLALLTVPCLHSAQAVIDVGSGAGLPGIPLSIMLPKTRFVLLDSQLKRVAFLQSVIGQLGLNARAVQARAEEAASPSFPYREAFDVAVARAVAPLNVLCELMLPFVGLQGHMLAMKGPGAAEELALAQGAIAHLGGAQAQIIPFDLPGRDWTPGVVDIVKSAPTPEKYPRAPGIPAKRPLKGS